MSMPIVSTQPVITDSSPTAGQSSWREPFHGILDDDRYAYTRWCQGCGELEASIGSGSNGLPVDAAREFLADGIQSVPTTAVSVKTGRPSSHLPSGPWRSDSYQSYPLGHHGLWGHTGGSRLDGHLLVSAAAGEYPRSWHAAAGVDADLLVQWQPIALEHMQTGASVGLLD